MRLPGARAGGLGQAAGGAADDGAGLGGGLVPHQQPLAEHGGLPVLAVHVEGRRCPEDVEPVHENEGSRDGCSQQLNREREDDILTCVQKSGEHSSLLNIDPKLI